MIPSNIVIITFLLNKAFISPLSSLEQILCQISDEVYSIEGVFNELHTQNKGCKINKYRILHQQNKRIITRIVRLFYLNLRMSLKLVQISKNIDLCIIFAGEWEFMPILTAKLLRKKVIWLMPSYLPHMLKYDSNISPIVQIYSHIQKISFHLTDKIVLHSENLIEEWGMAKYQDKIIFANEYFIDFEKFKMNIKNENREKIIGFIGRLSHEKGIINFLHAIPSVMIADPSIKFLIIGDGSLQTQVKEYIAENELTHNVKLLSWVRSDEIPTFLNKLKLLVIPSYTESGPIIALEAMACGTPILISKVGQVHNLIKNGKNGFLLDDNDSNTISKDLIKILNYDNLNKTGCNAAETAKEEFSYSKTIDKWKDILGD